MPSAFLINTKPGYPQVRAAGCRFTPDSTVVAKDRFTKDGWDEINRHDALVVQEVEIRTVTKRSRKSEEEAA